MSGPTIYRSEAAERASEVNELLVGFLGDRDGAADAT